MRYIGQGSADGGYRTWDKFEDAPEGWNNVREVGTVCPRCWEDYIQMLERYKNML